MAFTVPYIGDVLTSFNSTWKGIQENVGAIARVNQSIRSQDGQTTLTLENLNEQLSTLVTASNQLGGTNFNGNLASIPGTSQAGTGTSSSLGTGLT
jgi:hypothetical protein